MKSAIVSAAAVMAIGPGARTDPPARARRMNRTILTAFVAVALAAPASAQCAGDLNGDSQVNGADLSILLNAWGPCPSGNPGCTGDLTLDGIVNGADLGTLLENVPVEPPKGRAATQRSA